MARSVRRKWVTLSILGCLGVLALCGLGLALTFRCGPPPPSPCPIDTLLVDQSVIPEPLIGLGHSEPSAHYGVEFEEVRFIHPQEYDGGKVCQAVYRGLNEPRAIHGYRQFVESYFYPGSYFFCHDEGAVWELPSEITFESSADEWRLGCTVGCSTEPQTCQYIGRYGVYFVWYYAWMSDVMTYTEFVTILDDIDMRMTRCVAGASAN